MSHSEVDSTADATSQSFLLDGDAPRLGGSVPAPTRPDAAAPPPATAPDAPTTSSPIGPKHHSPSPVLGAPGSAPLPGSADLRPDLPTTDGSTPITPHPPDGPTLPTADGPTLPNVAPIPASAGPAPASSRPVEGPAATSSRDEAPAAATPEDTSDDGHPMAHLMPQKAAPNEASKRAAEIRAAKRAKARKVKIGVALGALVVAVLAGPPLVGWVSDALADAGSTDVDE